jgi:hypothetical protein
LAKIYHYLRIIKKLDDISYKGHKLTANQRRLYARLDNWRDRDYWRKQEEKARKYSKLIDTFTLGEPSPVAPKGIVSSVMLKNHSCDT